MEPWLYLSILSIKEHHRTEEIGNRRLETPTRGEQKDGTTFLYTSARCRGRLRSSATLQKSQDWNASSRAGDEVRYCHFVFNGEKKKRFIPTRNQKLKIPHNRF